MLLEDWKQTAAENRMSGQNSCLVRLIAITAIIISRQKPRTPIRERVFRIMSHFNVLEVNGAIIDNQTQVTMILETLSPAFLPFKMICRRNHLEHNLHWYPDTGDDDDVDAWRKCCWRRCGCFAYWIKERSGWL